MENFSGAQLSAFAPMRHTSRNPYLRIADIGADRFGPTLKGGKTLSLCVPACGMQRIFTQFKKHPPPFIPIGCCLYRHTGCMPGASLHPRELSRAFERTGATLWPKRGTRTAGCVPLDLCQLSKQLKMKDEPVNGSQAPQPRRGNQRAMNWRHALSALGCRTSNQI